jgi:hypothetical protein
VQSTTQNGDDSLLVREVHAPACRTPPRSAGRRHPGAGRRHPERNHPKVQAIEAYAAYRVGYHRGLDRLRANGWRGTGYVRWAHPENTGFLRSLDGLRRAAAAIGEDDEAERCAQFLAQLDPRDGDRRSWPSGVRRCSTDPATPAASSGGTESHLPRRADDARDHAASEERVSAEPIVLTADHRPPGLRQGVQVPRRRAARGPVWTPMPRRPDGHGRGPRRCRHGADRGLVALLPLRRHRRHPGPGRRLPADRGSSATSTRAWAGGCCRSGSAIGEDVPPWDLSVEGVTSLSADIHKYGYAFKGASPRPVPTTRRCWPEALPLRRLAGRALRLGHRRRHPRRRAHRGAWSTVRTPRARGLPAARERSA